MESVSVLNGGTGGSGIVADSEGLLGEILAVGFILTVYLLGVATDRDGRKV